MSGLTATDPLELVLSRLTAHGSKGSGHDWQCPAHDDRSPSLRIARLEAATTKRPDKIGDVVLHCHAGCNPADVLAALGLTFRDLLLPEHQSRAPKEARRPDLADLEARHERGELALVRVLGDVPEGLSPFARRVALELAYLFGLFHAAGETRPMPCSSRWMARRCGWFNSHGEPLRVRVSTALDELVRVGYVVAAVLPPRGGMRGTNTYAPPRPAPETNAGTRAAWEDDPPDLPEPVDGLDWTDGAEEL